MRDFEEELERLRWIFWLRITILMALMIAAMAVLSGFIGLLAQLSYATGSLDPSQYPELQPAFDEINKSPVIFALNNLYNVILWNGVILSGIWLFRFYSWARKALTLLLGLDMIVTVITLLYGVLMGTLKISHPVWMIGLNTVQVLVIIILSHPRMIEMIETLSQQRQANRSLDKYRHSLREKGDEE